LPLTSSPGAVSDCRWFAQATFQAAQVLVSRRRAAWLSRRAPRWRDGSPSDLGLVLRVAPLFRPAPVVSCCRLDWWYEHDVGADLLLAMPAAVRCWLSRALTVCWIVPEAWLPVRLGGRRWTDFGGILLAANPLGNVVGAIRSCAGFHAATSTAAGRRCRQLGVPLLVCARGRVVVTAGCGGGRLGSAYQVQLSTECVAAPIRA